MLEDFALDYHSKRGDAKALYANSHAGPDSLESMLCSMWELDGSWRKEQR